MIPEIDFKKLIQHDPEVLKQVGMAAQEIGFLLLKNTPISAAEIQNVLDRYLAFFKSDLVNKEKVDMAVTGSNRGWGRSKSEQVNPDKNPDYKEVFDCGVEVSPDDPQAHLSVYAPNLWPSSPSDFQKIISDYFTKARGISFDLLQTIAVAMKEDVGFFDNKFDKPMALLRGNFYPERPKEATDQDFGIAAHTDYGCLTLLATDGKPGLEVKLKDGSWYEVSAQPGTFVINFGEMLEIWSNKKIKATLHRVVGSNHERVSIPLFFNPNYDTQIAGAGNDPICAGDYLSKRYQETYLHLDDKP